MHQQILILSEVASLLRVRPITVRRMLDRGELPWIQAIRHIRIPAAAVEALLANQPVPLPPQRKRSNRDHKLTRGGPRHGVGD